MDKVIKYGIVMFICGASTGYGICLVTLSIYGLI